MSAAHPAAAGVCPPLAAASSEAPEAAVERALALTRGENEPVFREPWEAHAFAITLQLHRQGLFTWPEWAAALTQAIRQAQAAGDADSGDTYYQHWLAALERLVAAKGAGSGVELARYQRGWERAAARTPHGQAIELRPQDLG